jgi:hypothetical protein
LTGPEETGATIAEKLAGAVVSAQCFGYDTLTRLVDAYANTTGTCGTPFTFVEAGGGGGYSVNGTYAWGTGQQGQQVWTVQTSVSVGEGAGYSKGTSSTWVQQPDWGHWQ